VRHPSVGPPGAAPGDTEASTETAHSRTPSGEWASGAVGIFFLFSI
jgi:hypothetical protein